MLVAEARQPGDVLAAGEFGRARSHELERTLRVVRVPFGEGLALKRDLWLAKPEAGSGRTRATTEPRPGFQQEARPDLVAWRTGQVKRPRVDEERRRPPDEAARAANVRFPVPAYPSEFEIPDEWLAGLPLDRRPFPGTAYRATGRPVLVPLATVQPPRRNLTVTRDWLGFDRVRFRRVLEDGFWARPRSHAAA
jgi:hypothetical protein